MKELRDLKDLPIHEEASVEGFISVAFLWRKGSARALETAARAGLYLLIADVTV